MLVTSCNNHHNTGEGSSNTIEKVKPPIPPKPKWALQTSSSSSTDLRNKVGSDCRRSRSRPQPDLTCKQILVAATMPAAGILKKSSSSSSRPGPPPPPPPIIIRTTANTTGGNTKSSNNNNSSKPYVPPKPRRFLSRATEPNLTNRIQFEEEEPKTEDSYDYRDIDLAAEIFDFTPFPPRPKPPRKRPPLSALQNDDVVTNEDTIISNGVMATAAVEVAEVTTEEPELEVSIEETRVELLPDKKTKENGNVEHELSPDLDIEQELSVLERERWEIYGTDNISVEEEVVKHDDDVDVGGGEKVNNSIAGTNLAKFLKEHEGKPLSLEDVQRLEKLLDEAEDEEEEQEQRQQELEGKLRLPSVRFGAAEILEGMTDDEDRLTGDYSDVEFHHDNNDHDIVVPNGVPKSNAFLNGDNGTYEPIGPPDMRFMRPDLSNYKPPVPSSIVEDPFSWRRQGRRRYCSYGYDNQGIYSSAADKIMEGCQELEDRIVARDLSPPGTLLDTLGREKSKQKQKWIPPLPPPPVPPRVTTPSPPCPTSDDLFVQPSLDVGENGNKPVDENAVLSKLESEIIVDQDLDKIVVNGTSTSEELATVTTVPSKDLKLLESHEVKEVEDVVCKSKSLNETGNDVETAASVFEFIDADKNDEGNEIQKSETPVDVEVPVERPSRRDAFEKGHWRPQRPPPPKPQRPVRHKRFRSADPLPTPETQVSNIQPLLTNNNKPKRSESFHTAEDVRRRIDIQAQQFLRTPRKKELLSPTYMSSSSSVSYSTLGRPRSPFPVYSLVNKNMSRKKLTTTSSMTELSRPLSPLDARESLTPPIPPPPPQDNMDVGSESLATVIDPLVEEFNEWAAKKRLETFTDEDEEVAARKWENVNNKSAAAVQHDFTSDEECIQPSGSTTPATRPLPAPPAPPRHKTAKINDKEDFLTLSSGVSVLFCGILPKGDGGNMAVVPEMKVIRLTVGQLDASILRVSQIEAGVLRANRIEDSHSRGPPPSSSLDDGRPSSGGGGAGGSGTTEKQNTFNNNFEGAGPTKSPSSESQLLNNGDKICDTEGNYLSESAEVSITDACPTVISSTDHNHTSVTDEDLQQPVVNALVESKHFSNWVEGGSLSQDITEMENFVSVSSGNNRDNWSCDRDGGWNSPFHTVTSTTSESASYVTCDETLHDDMGLTDGLDDDPIDLEADDIDFVQNDDGEATGCPTPTELEMDITLGDDMNPDFRGVVPNVPPLTLSNSVFYTGAESGSSSTAPNSDKSNFSGLSSSAIEGIDAKPRMAKGRNKVVANGTTSWYVEENCVPGRIMTGTSESEQQDSNLGLVSSGLSHAKSNGTESSNGCDVTAGGTFIKRRIAELHVSQTHSKSTIARTLQCRHSEFYVSQYAEETESTATQQSEVKTIFSSNSDVEEEKNCSAKDGVDSVQVIVEHCDCLERRNSESSTEDESEASSSPRNLSTYSDVPSAGGVDEISGQSGHCSRAYYIARELMTSEKVFVDVLNLLTKDFRAAVEKANEALGYPIIPNEFFFQILDCLPQLRSLNEDLLKDLETRIEKWDEIGMISDVIVCKGPFLKLYTMYIKKFPVLTHNLEEACRRYPQFAQTVRDFESSDRCKKLELKHYMLKPVQRIPQYRMLLQDYLKHIDSDCPDYANTEAALAIVSEVASHANETMKEGDKFAKLMQIQSRISGNYEILKPGRTFVKEGELFKLCRKEMQPRLFILFSDSLLHLSAVSQGLLKIHHELPLSNMKVSVPTQEDFQNEFSVISVTRSFTLSASSPEERDEWISELRSAIRQTVSRHASFVQAKLHQLNIPDYRNKSETLGQQAPVWIPDSRVTMCQLCVHEFTLTFRRHHCRACGKVVCSVCSANRAPLFYLNYETARVCDECFTVLHKEIEDRVSGVETQDDSTEQSASNGSGIDSFTSGQKTRKLNLIDLKAQFKKYYRNSENKNHKRQLPKVLKEVCANDAGSSMSGYLYKKVKRTWKRQWFVIKDKVLYTYRASEDVAALESTPLLGFHVVKFAEPRDGIHQQLVFELRHPGYPAMEFYAESVKSAKRWLEAVEEATVLQ